MRFDHMSSLHDRLDRGITGRAFKSKIITKKITGKEVNMKRAEVMFREDIVSYTSVTCADMEFCPDDIFFSFRSLTGSCICIQIFV